MENGVTPEMWTIIGVGVALSSIGTGGFTLLWRYIAAAEKRAEARSAAIEKRAEERSAAVEKRAEARSAAIETRAEERSASIEKRAEARMAELKAELKADIQMLADRIERNHADLRQAMDTLVLNDQAKRLTILEEAVLRTTRSPNDREAQH